MSKKFKNWLGLNSDSWRVFRVHNKGANVAILKLVKSGIGCQCVDST